MLPPGSAPVGRRSGRGHEPEPRKAAARKVSRVTAGRRSARREPERSELRECRSGDGGRIRPVIQLFYEVDGRPQVYTLLKEEISIGRSSENDVVLNDFSVSRKHAILVRKDEAWFVRDNHSTNGVRVNGKNVSDIEVKDGDELAVGTFTLRLRDDPSIVSYPRGADKKESTSTFIRPLAEFNEDFGLEKDLPPADSTVLRKRGSLDLAYKNKVFEILVQVAKTLISADELETVLEKVMDLIFEYLPVDRGFLLLEEAGTLKLRMTRLKSTRRTTVDGAIPY